MEGVTTAIVLFIFVCICFPRLIDNRPQYYAAFACTLLIILLSGLVGLIAHEDFTRFAFMAITILQVAAVILLFLSAGGLTARGLTKEMAGAFEVIRRGEKEKEIIIPIGNREGRQGKRAVDTIGQPTQRYDISAQEGDAVITKPQPPAREPKKVEEGDGPIPLD